MGHRVASVILVLVLAACSGATETNVYPILCTSDADCGPSGRCVPELLDAGEVDAGGTDAGPSSFCRPR